jgi:hypothetical protein
MAIDGTLFNVADVQVNEQAFGGSPNQFGKGAYPQVRCVLLVECGSHTVVGMQISRYDESEVHGSHTLLCLIGRDMLLLVDAGIISAGFVQAVRNRRGHVPPESFLPELRFEDFVQMVDPLLPAQEEVPSAA